MLWKIRFDFNWVRIANKNDESTEFLGSSDELCCLNVAVALQVERYFIPNKQKMKEATILYQGYFELRRRKGEWVYISFVIHTSVKKQFSRVHVSFFFFAFIGRSCPDRFALDARSRKMNKKFRWISCGQWKISVAIGDWTQFLCIQHWNEAHGWYVSHSVRSWKAVTARSDLFRVFFLRITIIIVSALLTFWIRSSDCQMDFFFGSWLCVCAFGWHRGAVA